jgi:hypothetical protein
LGLSAKYQPEYVRSGIKDLDQARDWASKFVHWCNVEHLHSGIRYLSPNLLHAGKDHEILAARNQLYLAAQAAKQEGRDAVLKDIKEKIRARP